MVVFFNWTPISVLHLLVFHSAFSTKWEWTSLEYLSKIHKHHKKPNPSVNLSWLVNVCLLYIDPSSLCQKNVQARQK